MAWDFDEVQEQKARVQRDIAKRLGRGEVFDKLEVPQGSKKLATTFWGKAWCDHLQSYQEYDHRLPRGRSYLRQGNVYQLKIGPGLVSAMVAGSELYETSVHIKPLATDVWQDVVEACAGQVGSMLDLLAGKLGEGVLRVLTDPEAGIFPQSKEIRFDCSCPDHADMCKHVAAVLYGVGVLLDAQPELFFTLRSVDGAELLATSREEMVQDLTVESEGGLEGEDLSALFGIDLGH
jgi:uncharacterized Zn finger protein